MDHWDVFCSTSLGDLLHPRTQSMDKLFSGIGTLWDQLQRKAETHLDLPTAIVNLVKKQHNERFYQELTASSPIICPTPPPYFTIPGEVTAPPPPASATEDDTTRKGKRRKCSKQCLTDGMLQTGGLMHKMDTNESPQQDLLTPPPFIILQGIHNTDTKGMVKMLTLQGIFLP